MCKNKEFVKIEHIELWDILNSERKWLNEDSNYKTRLLKTILFNINASAINFINIHDGKLREKGSYELRKGIWWGFKHN